MKSLKSVTASVSLGSLKVAQYANTRTMVETLAVQQMLVIPVDGGMAEHVTADYAVKVPEGGPHQVSLFYQFVLVTTTNIVKSAQTRSWTSLMVQVVWVT